MKWYKDPFITFCAGVAFASLCVLARLAWLGYLG